MLYRIFSKIYVFLVLMLLSFFAFSINVFGSTNEEKIFKVFDVNDSFSNNRILVVTKEKSNKDNYTKEDFIDIGCKNVTCLNSNLKANGEIVLCLELEINSKANVLNKINDIMQREDVIYAGPDFELELASTPNDVHYNYQWGIVSSNIDHVWDYYTGTNNVTVGIIDTGIDASNSELYASVNVTLSRDFSNGSCQTISTSNDLNGHGTQVAGIIGAKGNNSIGIAGINWNIELVSLISFDPQGHGLSSYVAQALDYANLCGIPIINLSAAWSGNSNYYDYALNAVIESYQGLFICAAGNNGVDLNGNLIYPACIDSNNSIKVGALDNNDDRCAFSNYGSSVDIWCPGFSIFSTFPSTICCSCNHVFSNGFRLCELKMTCILALQNYMQTHNVDWTYVENNYSQIILEQTAETLTLNQSKAHNHYDDGYHYSSGTSLSAPYVTGVAALLLSINSSLSASQIKEAIINSAENIDILVPNSGTYATQIVKKLNAKNAVEYIFNHYPNTTISLDEYTTTSSYTKSLTSGDDYFNNKNVLYKLSVLYEHEYEFKILSSNATTIILYDENFNQLNYTQTNITGGTKISKDLCQGIYYLRIFFTNAYLSGNITTKVVGLHNHSYGAPYLWKNYRQHQANCICGDNHLEGHAIMRSELNSSSNYSICILCGGLAESGFIGPSFANNNGCLSANGSYILPNGIFVLMDNDVDDFLNGKLLFNNNIDTMYIINNDVPITMIKRKYE